LVFVAAQNQVQPALTIEQGAVRFHGLMSERDDEIRAHRSETVAHEPRWAVRIAAAYLLGIGALTREAEDADRLTGQPRRAPGDHAREQMAVGLRAVGREPLEVRGANASQERVA